MKRFGLCVVAALLVGLGLSARESRAADDVEFATPVVTDYSPACAGGSCSAVSRAQHGTAFFERRRPVISWFQEHRPVRRVLRGTVRVLGWRCCR